MMESVFRPNRWVTSMKGDIRKKKCRPLHSLLAVLFVLLSISCSKNSPMSLEASPSAEQFTIAETGFVIQVGAFRNLDNAVHLTLSLNADNLGAYYFKHESGLYKVRFGNYLSRGSAEENAERLKQAGFIQEFYIVSPETFAISKAAQSGLPSVRDEIISRARSFLGLPYRWGGFTPDMGFDCSGLTMAVYDLVGLHLPRTSLAQFRAGTPVSMEHLDKGDLVFFLGQNRNRISHVGIYTGNGNFIHAPGENKIIRTESLSNQYFQDRFAGARTYLNR
jgi:cell wall-associated NlpC family hydrolase